jgi:hypothetical protein
LLKGAKAESSRIDEIKQVLERKVMEPTIEQRLREVLPEFPSEDVQTIAAFAEFLWGRRQTGKPPVLAAAELSEEEHNRILQVLDAVSALSAEAGPPVSNRDHDRYLYGRS